MTDEAVIRKVVADFIEAYNAGDWNRAKNVLADDVVDMSGGSRTRAGKEAIKFFRSRVESAHAKFKPHLEVQVDEIQVAGDWAFDRGTLSLTLVPREGGEATHIRQRFVEIWKRQADGQWKVCRLMDNHEEAEAGPAGLPK